jgi:uncharacterized membrane protein
MSSNGTDTGLKPDSGTMVRAADSGTIVADSGTVEPDAAIHDSGGSGTSDSGVASDAGVMRPPLRAPTNFFVIDGPGGGPTTINGISSAGTLVGFTTMSSVNANFLRSANGKFTALDLGDPAGMANGVNAGGDVVGVAQDHAILLSHGTVTTLNPPGSSASIAFGINDVGTIVGQFTDSAGHMPGFMETNGVYTTIVPTPTATVTNVQAINGQGQAIGFYSADGTHQHGFLYDAHTNTTTLLPDPSTALTQAEGLVLTQFLSLNDQGVAVGYYQTSNGSQYGFLFDLVAMNYVFVDAPGAARVAGVQITQITGVDNAGLIAGFFVDAGGAQHGFVADSVVKVPTHFAVVDGPGGGATTINAIANDGTVVGFTTDNGANANFTRTRSGAFTPLDLGDPAGGVANGINQAGQVVGVSHGIAVLIANGTKTEISIPGASASVAFGINDQGTIVGQYTDAVGHMPGFVRQSATVTPINPTPTATVTNVQGVNNLGVAIGFFSADGVHQHGFIDDTRSATITLLPDPSTEKTRANGLELTQFLGINDLGVAVGYYQTGDGSQYGFLFDLLASAYIFLDAPGAAPVNGVQITQITGIDNAGEITGFYVDAAGVQHGFVAGASMP